MRPGEVLFYGPGWFHETQNLDTPTVTLSSTIVHKANYLQVSEQLHSGCARGNVVKQFSSELCDALQKCYADWERRWQGLVDPQGGPQSTHRDIGGRFPRSVLDKEESKAHKNSPQIEGAVEEADLQRRVLSEYPSWRDVAEAEGRHDVIDERDYFQPHWTPAVNVY